MPVAVALHSRARARIWSGMPSVSVVTANSLPDPGVSWSSCASLAVLTSELTSYTRLGEVRTVGDEVARGGVELDRQRLVAAVDRHRAGGGGQPHAAERVDVVGLGHRADRGGRLRVPGQDAAHLAEAPRRRPRGPVEAVERRQGHPGDQQRVAQPGDLHREHLARWVELQLALHAGQRADDLSADHVLAAQLPGVEGGAQAGGGQGGRHCGDDQRRADDRQAHQHAAGRRRSGSRPRSRRRAPGAPAARPARGPPSGWRGRGSPAGWRQLRRSARSPGTAAGRRRRAACRRRRRGAGSPARPGCGCAAPARRPGRRRPTRPRRPRRAARGSARAGRLIDSRSAQPLVRPRPSSRKVEAVGTRLGMVGSSAAYVA